MPRYCWQPINPSLQPDLTSQKASDEIRDGNSKHNKAKIQSTVQIWPGI